MTNKSLLEYNSPNAYTLGAIVRFARTSLAVSVSLALTACGGGGGGGGLNTNSNPYLRSSVPYYTPTNGGSYQTLANGSTMSVIQDVFAQDLNNDSVQEVVVGGRMSASGATVANWSNHNLQVYGWNRSSTFTNETSSWFSGVSNSVVGTEPAVRFGDFNGDGHIDMFVAPSTDGILSNTPGSVFLNSGSSSFNVRTDLNFGNVWSHDAAVSDMNGDGYADIVITDYNGKPAIAFGSAAGSFNILQANSASGGSGISIADYLNNGTKTLILTDASATGNQDTKLYSWSNAGGVLALTEVAALPASRFYLAKWSTQLAAAGRAPHDIRNIAIDFNRDGVMDVVVFSTLPDGTSTTHGYSEVQFLRNDGGGTFTDVTDSVLSGFNNASYQTYQPTLVDVNKDGLLDILMSSPDYTGAHDSHRVLLQTSDGKFTEAYGSVLKDFFTQTQTLTGGTSQDQMINIAAGPNGDMYLITAVTYNDNGVGKTAVYAARIGSNGTTSVQQTLANISTVWPYLTSVAANDALARTASSFINGIPVIDWNAVMNPIGGLGITLDGRTGQRVMLSGSISVPGMDRNLLNGLQAVDAMGRNFTVNMSGMSQQPGIMPINYSLADTTDMSRNWSSRFITEDQRDWNGFSLSGQDVTRFSTSISNRHFGDKGPTTYRVGMTRMPGSPWFSFNGVFGSPESSTILDFTATRNWANGLFAQGGVMQTSTELNTGLVQSVTPLWAGYAVAGYQDPQWTAYAGLQPTIFAGHLDMKLPTSVDRDGVMHYTNKTVEIRNQAVGFVGLERRWEKRTYSWKLSSVVNDQGQYQARLTYGYKF